MNQAYAAGLPDAVLVVGPSWVGDMVMAQSLFKALRTASAGTAIDVLAPGWSLPLLAMFVLVCIALGHMYQVSMAKPPKLPTADEQAMKVAELQNSAS